LGFGGLSLEPSFSSGFAALDYYQGRSDYYKQFTDQEVGTLTDTNDQKGIVASLDYIVRDFFLNEEEGPVKFVLITNMKSDETREAYLSWSDRLLSEVMKVKERTGASYVLFLLSRRMQESFRHLIRPRRKKRDQLRFNHLRSLNIEMIQGRRFFAEPPLEHVKIRRATKDDAHSISGYIKRATQTIAIKRVIGEDVLIKEIESFGEKGFSNLALAESFDKKIVGVLGVYDPSDYVKASLDLDEVKDSIFFVTQSFLKIGSYIKKDLRPVFDNKVINFRFFTHNYCNNKDIFYSLIHWWLDETSDTKPVFLYPHYKGELKTAPPSSLFTSEFPADLYLMQDPDDPPSQLLKPNFFSPHIDIDLPLLF
jgi:hypothetical protein